MESEVLVEMESEVLVEMESEVLVEDAEDFDFLVEPADEPADEFKTSTKTTKTFKCTQCSETFKRMYGLKSHIKHLHGEEFIFNVPAAPGHSSSCLGCNFVCREICDLREHLQIVHQMSFNYEHKKFGTFEEFISWKSSVEEKNSCFYVKARGDIINKKSQRVTYNKSSRSGAFKPASTGKRITKSSGTSKISCNCTSTLKVLISNNDGVNVEACHTHYGHKKDLEHTKLREHQRNEIEMK